MQAVTFAPESQSDNIFQRSGLTSLMQMLRLFGYKMETDPNTNRKWFTYFVIGRIIVSIIGVLLHIIEYIYLRFTQEELTLSALCHSAGLLWMPIGNLYITCQTFVYIKKYNRFFIDLADILNDLPPRNERESTKKKIKLAILIIIGINIIEITYQCVSLGIAFFLKNMFQLRLLKCLPNDESQYVIIVVIWISTINGYYFRFYTWLIPLICHLINLCFDNYLLTNRNVLSVTRRQRVHQKLSQLVNQINELISGYMLMSSITGTVVMIMDIRLTSIKSPFPLYHLLLLYVFNSFRFVVKVVMCSSVNEKVMNQMFI